MNNVATNKIISRIKEGFEGFLSIFDGNKYTTSEEAVLSEEAAASLETLRRSLESIAERAGRYEKNGIIDLEKTEKTKNPEYTPIETPKIKTPNQQYPETKINRSNNELEL